MMLIGVTVATDSSITTNASRYNKIETLLFFFYFDNDDYDSLSCRKVWIFLGNAAEQARESHQTQDSNIEENSSRFSGK